MPCPGCDARISSTKWDGQPCADCVEDERLYRHEIERPKTREWLDRRAAVDCCLMAAHRIGDSHRRAYKKRLGLGRAKYKRAAAKQLPDEGQRAAE